MARDGRKVTTGLPIVQSTWEEKAPRQLIAAFCAQFVRLSTS